VRGVALAGLAVAAVAAVSGCGGGGKAPIRIGVLGVCQGVFAPFYDEEVAGAELPLLQHGGKLSGPKPADSVSGATVSGHRVDLSFGCSDETGERALAETRRLVEKEHVQILVGAATSAAGIAIRDYAKTKPGTTFLIALSPTAESTLSTPARNVFRFTTHSLQWTAGLGTYAYRTLGWRRAVVVGNDFSFPYDEVAGFVAEFCSLGGQIVRRVWAEAGPPPIRERADGYFLSEFLPQYLVAAVHALPVRGPLARRILLGGAAILNAGALGPRALGVVGGSGAPFGSALPAWRAFLADFAKAFPRVQFAGFSVSYFNTMEAALRGLEAVGGDLSGGEARYMSELTRLVVDLPTGRTRLDAHRQAIAPNYLLQVQTGKPGLRTIRTVGPVDDSYGGRFGPGKPLPSRTNPPCTRGNPPRWAR
jgi:branched-chain amino acid transport system substrate-binding protein